MNNWFYLFEYMIRDIIILLFRVRHEKKKTAGN